MVTSQINSVSFSAAAVNTVTTDSGAFLQALQQEIGTANILPDNLPADISDGSSLTGTVDSALAEQLSQLIEQMLGGADNGGEDKNLQLLEALMKLLNGEKDEETKKIPTDALLQIVQQMIQTIKEQLKEESQQTYIPATTRSDTVIEDLRDAWIKISPDFSQEPVPTAEAPVLTAEEKPEEEKAPASDENGGFATAQSAAALTAQFSIAGANVRTEETLTEDAVTVQPAAAERLVQTAYLSAAGVTTQSAETTENAGTQPETAIPAIPQPQTTENTAAPEKVLEALVQFAKDNLGLTSAELEAPAQQTEETRPQITVVNTVRTADVSDELTQLLSAVQGRTAENPETAQQNTDQTASEALAKEEPRSFIRLVKTDEKEQEALPAQNSQPKAENVFVQPAQTEQITETQQAPVTTQISEQIIAHLQTADNGKTTFTMTLNPEALGKIEVKISTEEGRVSVEITAQSRQTQSILAERLDGLRETLKQNGVELEKFQVVYSPEETATQHQTYDGSSKNPYSRRQNHSAEHGDKSDDEFAELLASL